MSALQEYSLDISDQYQHLQFISSQTDSLADTFHQQGHLEYGHDLKSLLAEYEIEGVPGIYQWFEHMAQDFVSAEGIPLPFAEIIQNMTGLSTNQAIEWLTANLTDAVEMGAEAAIMAFFRKNPKAYTICLALGITFGLYNTNPMMVAMNGFLYFNKLRKEGRLQDGIWNSADKFIRTSFAVVDRVATYTFITNLAMELTGGSLASLTGHFVDMLGVGGKVAKTAEMSVAAATTAEMVEGIANFGLSLLVGKAVGKLVEKMNANVKNELAKVEPKLESRRQLIKLLRKQVSPETLAPVIELMDENGVYKAMLR